MLEISFPQNQSESSFCANKNEEENNIKKAIKKNLALLLFKIIYDSYKDTALAANQGGQVSKVRDCNARPNFSDKNYNGAIFITPPIF